MLTYRVQPVRPASEASSGNGNPLQTLFEGHTVTPSLQKANAAEVFSVEFSPDGKRLLSGGDDARVVLWDLESGKDVLTLQPHESYVHVVAFSPDGTQILSGSGDATLTRYALAHLGPFPRLLIQRGLPATGTFRRTSCQLPGNMGLMAREVTRHWRRRVSATRTQDCIPTPLEKLHNPIALIALKLDHPILHRPPHSTELLEFLRQ